MLGPLEGWGFVFPQVLGVVLRRVVGTFVAFGSRLDDMMMGERVMLTCAQQVNNVIIAGSGEDEY